MHCVFFFSCGFGGFKLFCKKPKREEDGGGKEGPIREGGRRSA